MNDEEQRILIEALDDIEVVRTLAYGDEEHALALQNTVEIDLAKWFGVELIHKVDRGRLFRAIERLEKRGLAVRREPMAGRKRKCLHLTAQGLLVAKTLAARTTRGASDA